MEDKGSAPFLTKATYEKSLFRGQINQEWDRGVVLQTGDQQRYNPRPLMDNVKKAPANKTVDPTEQQANKQKQPTANPVILKVSTIEVRGLDKSPSSFNFQLESQKLRIPMPLIEPMKNESLKESILEDPEPKASQASNDYANLQRDQPAIILSPVVKICEVSSPSSYVSLSIQETIPHNFPLGTRASHNSMTKADMDKLSLDSTKPTQLASTQLERAIC